MIMAVTKVTRQDLEDTGRCGKLVDLILDDIGIGDVKTGGAEIRAATRQYWLEFLQGWLDCTDEEDLTEFYHSLELQVGSFAEGYEACLKKQLALQVA